MSSTLIIPKSFYSPLEQFDIFNIFDFDFTKNIFFPLDFSFTNSSLFILLSIIFLFFFFIFSSFKLRVVPKLFQFLLEELYAFVFDLVNVQLGKKGNTFFPFAFGLFFFILFNNLLGIMPFGFVPTSHFAFTLFLSSSIWFFLVITGFINLGFSFLKLFVPSVPFAMLFLLVPLEVTSYVIRMFTLSIRLSSNILSGHVLMFILSNFALQFVSFNVFVFSLFFVIFFFVAVLEIAVAFIQAFIFVTLVCIYLSESFYTHN